MLLYLFRRLLVAGLSAATALFTHSESKTVEYTFTLVPLRASPALPNVTTRAELNNPALSPDCNLDRLMLLVNNVFPGPTIRADAYDIIKLTLINESPQSVSLHFHGLDMRGQPYSDGTSSVNQCAVGPLETIEYEFDVTNNVGTHYWHGHYNLERADGFQGPIIISDSVGLVSSEYLLDYYAEEIIFLQDWYHQDGDTRHAGLDSVPFIWIGYAQSFLINGGGIFAPCLMAGEDSIYDSPNPVWKPTACAADCADIEKYIKTITVEPGETYRLRIIGAQELIGVNFAIQSHNMTVVEADGTIVEPFVVENLDIMPGQRYSVLVTFDKDVGTYLATTGVRYRAQSPTGYILFKYQGAGEGVPSVLKDEVNNLLQGTAGYSTAVPPHPVWNDTEPTIALESKLFTKDPDGYYDYHWIKFHDPFIRRIVIAGNQLTQNSTGKLRWAANNVTSMMGPAPMITLAYDAVTSDGALPWPDTQIPGTVIVPDKPPTPYNYTAPVQESVGTFNDETGPSYIPLVEGEVVEIVLQNTLALNGVAEMHTWHLHGHSFWVVGSGVGIFDENTDPDSYNLVNPVRRDTATVLPYGWTALRFQSYNPGAWFFHCAQPAHAAMGMGVIFVISPEKCPPPPPMARSCLETSMIPESESSSSNVIPKIKATALMALAIFLLV